MVSALEWKGTVRVSAALLGFIGVADFIYAFWYPEMWSSLINAVSMLLVCAWGFRATHVHHPDSARRYFVIFLVLAIVMILVHIIAIIVGSVDMSQTCTQLGKHLDSECKSLFIGSSIASLFFLVIAMGGCLGCARAYWKELEREHYSHFDPLQGDIYSPVLSASAAPINDDDEKTARTEKGDAILTSALKAGLDNPSSPILSETPTTISTPTTNVSSPPNFRLSSPPIVPALSKPQESGFPDLGIDIDSDLNPDKGK